MGFDFDLPDDEPEDDGSDGPTFDDDLAPRSLREACQQYAEWAVEKYDTFDEVDLSDVSIEVSERMKRSAGRAIKKSDDLIMRFSYRAYKEWGWSGFKSTIRHEIIHIWQYQENGTADHGFTFRKMADEVGCSKNCDKFTDYEYGIFCSDCDDMVAGRYRRSKMVKKAERYNSKCCGASCYSEVL